MMKIARAATVVTVAAATVGGVLLGSAPASATTDAINPWVLSAPGATVKFWADGDVFRIYDTKSDGKAAHFTWYMPSTGDAGSGDDYDGNGTNKKYARNLVDGKLIQVNVWETGGPVAFGSTNT